MSARITRHLLATVWRSHAGAQERWVVWLLLGLAVLAPLGVWGLVPGPQAGRAALAVAAVVWSIVLAVAWALLCFEALRQNLPVLARTVPGQVVALRRALMSVALPLVGVAGLCSVALTGHETPGVLLACALCGLLALLLRWPVAVVAGLLVLTLLPLLLLGPAGTRAGLRAMAPWLWQAAWLDGVALLILWGVLRAVILAGGPGHGRAQARLEARGRSPCRAGLLAGLGWRLGGWLGARSLARPETPRLARYALGLGPGGQAGAVALLALALGGLGAVVMAAGVVWPDSGLALSLRSGFLIGAAGNTVLMAAQPWQQLLLGSRHEQALMCLLPGTPLGAAQSRWLAALLARRYLLSVASQTSVLLLLGWLFPMPPGADWVPAAAACAAGVSAGGLTLLWRDWSRTTPAQSRRVGAMVLLYLAALGGATVWTVLLRWPWWSFALGGAVLLAGLLLWRWQCVLRLPQPFPVARTAG